MAALGDKEFLDKGGKLAFALSYQYPAEEMESVKNAAFGSILKGNDYLLAHTLASLSLTSEIRAVYPPMRPPKEHLLNQLKNLVSSGNPGHDLDAFSSFGIVKTTDPQPDYPPAGSRLPAGSALYTARNFKGINENSCVESEEEGSDGEPVGPLVEWTGASVDFELIWARRPVKGTFAVASTYARYGNEASTSHSYVAGALVVEIPAFGEGSRKTEGGMKL
ncbi:hypothetical protein FRB90_004987 [Tulasnella sp. 427]|nr:hypothetical protein FRB90_004987 [Tulasnella sp. 427]